MENDETEKFFQELERESRKYVDLLFEINKAFRKEVRKIGFRKNVVPVKYILPDSFINRLLENKEFKRTWERKIIWRYIKEEDKKVGAWIKIHSFPNIGGVPVVRGKKLQVIVEKIPSRKRRKPNAE